MVKDGRIECGIPEKVLDRSYHFIFYFFLKDEDKELLGVQSIENFDGTKPKFKR